MSGLRPFERADGALAFESRQGHSRYAGGRRDPVAAGASGVPGRRALRLALRFALALCVGMSAMPASARSGALPPALLAQIDGWVESERRASGIPGIALAVVAAEGPAHLRGFGDDGRGRPITADTPFPVGSLTKSFTALLVRQAADAGQLDVDAPVRRYLPWFRVADAEASARITVRHLLNQSSGFSRADGLAPLRGASGAGVEETARALGAVRLKHAPGERYEYSNLNYVVLGAVLESVTGMRWQELVGSRLLRPLGLSHTHADLDAARRDGMTAVHRMWFGVPIAQPLYLPPGLAPTGGLVASAADMASYLRMLLAGGAGASGRLVSADGVAQVLAPASPPGHSRLLSADFDFRYGEGWFVGSFGAAADARWHLGNLPSFAAWMILLPDTRQAVAVLINANSELPFNEVNAVMSRLPIGIVNLLRGEPPPQGPSLRRAYLPFNAASLLIAIGVAALAQRAARAVRGRWSVVLLLAAIGMVVGLHWLGLSASLLAMFAPDLAIVFAAVGLLLCLPAAWRTAVWAQRTVARSRQGGGT